MAYLDANATEPLRPQARAAAAGRAGPDRQPVSVHTAGRAARRVLEEAARTVAARFGAARRASCSPRAARRPMRWPSHGLGQGAGC